MRRYVAEPSDRPPWVLYWLQAIGPTLRHPRSLLKEMTTAQLRIIAKVRQVWKLIDWQTVGEIVWEGLKLTIALTIVCGMYTVEGTIKSYNWIQPRLANLLQHPQQTITKGPAFLYAESMDSLFVGNVTIGQKWVIKVALIWDNLMMFVDDTRETVTAAYIRRQRMI